MQRTFMRMVRENKGLTIRVVAKKLGIDESYLGQIERGLYDPSLKVSTKLEKFYGIPITTLLKRDNEED